MRNLLITISSLYLIFLLPCHDKCTELYYHFKPISNTAPAMFRLKAEAKLPDHQPGRPGLGRPGGDGPPSQGDSKH